MKRLDLNGYKILFSWARLWWHGKEKNPNLGEESGVLETKIQMIMERKAGKILKIKDEALEVASQHIECYE